MSMRILLVGRQRPLAARLREEYFDVTLRERLDLEDLREVAPDILLLAGEEHFEVYEALRGAHETQRVPVVMLDSSRDSRVRLRALAAGADDVISQLLDESVVMARLRSLGHAKALTETLYAYPTAEDVTFPPLPERARLLLVHEQMLLDKSYEVTRILDPATALARTRVEEFELFVLSLEQKNALRVCAQLAHKIPLVVLCDSSQISKLVRALDLGASDYLMTPVDEEELRLRLDMQLRRARHKKHLCGQIAKSIEMSLLDPLTGLYNRRCLQIRLPGVLERGGLVALCLIDIDHFKKINDTYGHDAGDTILESVGQVLRSAVRRDDILYRIGGEEFVAALQGASVEEAYMVARRIRDFIAKRVFYVKGQAVAMTVSIGLAFFDPARDTVDTLIKRADKALYRAKKGGRDSVV